MQWTTAPFVGEVRLAFDRPADGIETADAPAALSQRSYTMNAITGMLGWAVLCALAAVALSLAGVLALHKTALAQERDGSQTPTPESDGLFYEVDGDPPPSIGVDALNSRLVGIDFGQLSEVTKSLVSTRDPVTRTSPIPQTLVLNLFDDVEFIGIVEHVEPTSSGHALWGGLEGVELGTMTLVVNGSVVVGTVRTPGAVYSIRTAGGGAYVVRQIDESSLPPLGEPLRRQFPEPDAPLAPPQGREPAESAAPDGPSTPAPTPTPVSTLPAVPSARVLGETLAGGLFWEVEGDPPPSGNVETLASRLVGIDFGQLAQVTAPPIDSKNSATGSSPTAQLLVLNLFDDVVFTGIVEHIERTSSGHALRGRLEGVDWGTFTLVVSGGIVVGTVRTPEGVYEIRTVGVGTYVIRQIDESSLPPLGEPLEGPLSTPETRSESDDVPPDDGYMIDVMVVYTPLAKRREGGRAAIEALIDLFVVETNQAYANSRVTHRIRLVLREEVNYTEDGISRIDLNRLKNDSDGYMDDVHELRDLYAADLVHIVVGRGNVCGRANLNRGESPAEDEAYGFGLTVDYCGGLVFAHELGHNMGLAHDRYQLGVPRTGSHYGYVNQRAFEPGAPESARWRTIMAYAGQCREVGGFYCPRIAYFSNREVTHNGDPTGVPVDNPSTDVDGPAHAVKTLNERREITANFRRSSTSPTPRVHLTLSPYWLSENGGMSTVTATLHKPSSSDTTVTVTASPSDAVTLSANRVLTIPAGQAVSRGAVTITGVDNGVQTGDVTVIVSAMAENPSSMGVVEPEPVALAVADDETTPVVTLSLSPAEIVEIDGMTFVTAMLDNRSVADTAVTVSATPAEVVEEIEENILTIPAGQSASIGEGVKINAVDDSELTEAEKLVTVSGTAANSQGVTGPESVTLTINDDEAPFFPYDSIAYTFTEGLAGSRFLPEAAYGKGPLTYSLSPAPSNGVTFTPGPPVRMGTSATSAASPETSYTLTVTDADGVKDTMTISITVRKGVCSNSAAVSEYTNPGIVDDCEALLVSRDVLGGGKSLNWSEDISIGEWEGVLIVHGRVANLQIPEEGLTGTIPSELGSLSSLQNLWLSGNQLTGEIPAELGNLSNLQELKLSDNQLTGEIPAELGNLSNLQLLWLHVNQLTGEIPPELGRLSNLNHLILADNGLTGEIPPELGRLSNLTGLWLHVNQLTGEIPPELGGLSNLERLYLGGNLLTGCVPDGLRDVPNNDFVRLGLPFCSEHPCVTGGLVDVTDLGLMADCGTLLAARDSLAGTATLNWSADIPIADWNGVVVGGTPGRATELRLSGLGLTGQIPPELGDLPDLQLLDLRDNQLAGGIPTELGDLVNLQELYLDGNRLTGCVPDGLRDVPRNDFARLGLPFCSEHPCVNGGAVSDTTNLGLMSDCETLLAARDTLAGAASLNWAADNLVTLWDGVTVAGTPRRVTALFLHQKGLTGEIPAELGNLSNLQSLELTSNQLTGEIPAELGNLSNLQNLWLSGDQLTGEIPAELGNLSNLQELTLSDNQLTGEIPAELGNLSNLQLLSLWDNQLTGEIPAELGNLSNLQLLSLWDNQLTGEIPAELGSLTNLQWLELRSNQLTGEIPAELGNLSNLQELSLWDNQLTGEIPAELGSLTNLQSLVLGSNQLTGEIPAELGNLSNLQELSLWENQLTGEIPAELGNLSNLQNLWLSGNQLTGEIPAELGSLTNLQSLSLWENQLTGEIPAELGNLSNLQDLSLSGNQLTGEIPAELGSLTNLQWLELTSNQLTGEIPAELGNLSNLHLLTLSDNQLTGEIPAELGSLTNLQSLVLGSNQLTGEIPAELGNLSNLQELYLSSNQLTGEIPTELSSLANLVALSLSNNQLSGCIPEGLRDVTDNDLEDLDLPFCDVLLSGLTISPGSTTPPFNPYHTDYAVVVGQSQVTVTATIDHNSTLHFLDQNRVEVADADGSLDGYQVDLGLGVTTISISVISQDGLATLTYTIQVSRATRPVAPVISIITPGRGSLSVSWTAPRETGGANITSYDLRHIESRAPDKADANWLLVDDAWTGGLLSYTITGLTGSTQYDVQVRAVNVVGYGPWSNQASDTVPVNELPVFTEGVKATRLVAENSAEATNIGMPIAASDADDDTLTYTLGGSDAALFAIDSGTGQIRVGDATTLDYETKTSYSVDVSAADPYGATAMITLIITVTNMDEEGTVTLSTMEPQVGVELTATLDDPDGTVSGATWQWAWSSDGSTWADITEATDTAYTPVAADEGNYLRATASYTDGEGSGKSAQGISDNLVTAGDPLLNRYDANKNGLIDRDEVLQAVVDYFNNIITRDEVLGVVVLYFSS